MRKSLIAAALLVFAIPIPAQEQGGKAAPQTPAAYRELVAEFAASDAKAKAAMKALTASDEYKKAVADKDTDGLKKLRATVPTVDRAGLAQRALKLAGESKGDDAARYYAWVISISAPKDSLNTALDALIKDHVKSPVMLEVLEAPSFTSAMLTSDASKAGERLAAIEAGSELPLAKAYAIYYDAMRLTRGKDVSEENKKKSAELMTKAEKLAAGTALADQIAAPRFEKEHLQIGMAAPDIEGEDLEGVKFKLSDYKGKVVVVDFWGNW